MQSGKVLIVEDDPSIRMLTRTVLESRGYEVHEVEDGPSAVPAARATDPDVILLDIGLPGMDGFGVLSLLKADAELAAAPVIMVTAWAEPELVAKALDRGAHDYVRKPFDIGDLSARVDAAAHLKGLAATQATTTTVDGLTAVPNRFQLTDDLIREVARAQRSGHPFSVVLVALDRFGDADDLHGPGAGDGVLHAVARRLGQRVRRSDALGRWGRAEFLVVAPDTDLGGAGALAEDLRRTLGERPLDTPGAAVRVTASFGVAQWNQESHEHLLERAAAALRDAQAGQGDAVRLAGALPAHA